MGRVTNAEMYGFFDEVVEVSNDERCIELKKDGETLVVLEHDYSCCGVVGVHYCDESDVAAVADMIYKFNSAGYGVPTGTYARCMRSIVRISVTVGEDEDDSVHTHALVEELSKRKGVQVWNTPAFINPNSGNPVSVFFFFLGEEADPDEIAFMHDRFI